MTYSNEIHKAIFVTFAVHSIASNGIIISIYLSISTVLTAQITVNLLLFMNLGGGSIYYSVGWKETNTRIYVGHGVHEENVTHLLLGF